MNKWLLVTKSSPVYRSVRLFFLWMRHHAFLPGFFRQFPSVGLFFLTCCVYILLKNCAIWNRSNEKHLCVVLSISRSCESLLVSIQVRCKISWLSVRRLLRWRCWKSEPFNYRITFHKALKYYVIMMKFSRNIHAYLNKTSM